MLESTGKFKVKDIVYKTSDFAIARGYWAGQSNLTLACRWYDEGKGYPQTFGHPQWMLFPVDIKVEMPDLLNPEDSEVVIRFPRPSSLITAAVPKDNVEPSVG